MAAKSISLFCACFILWASGGAAQEAKPAPPPGMPEADGAYCRQDPAKWTKIDPVFVDQSKIKGMNAYMMTEGIFGLGMNYVYLGVSAPLQLSERRPVFYVRGGGVPREAQLVQLTQGKENRTVRTSSAEVSSGNKGGFRKGDIRPVAVVLFSDGSYSVTPQQDLKPGEYLLALGSAVTGFDFGITASKK